MLLICLSQKFPCPQRKGCSLSSHCDAATLWLKMGDRWSKRSFSVSSSFHQIANPGVLNNGCLIKLDRSFRSTNAWIPPPEILRGGLGIRIFQNSPDSGNVQPSAPTTSMIIKQSVICLSAIFKCKRKHSIKSNWFSVKFQWYLFFFLVKQNHFWIDNITNPGAIFKNRKRRFVNYNQVVNMSFLS